MAAVLTEPVAVKAATLTPVGEMAFFSFPIEKVEDGPDGEVTVVGKATDGTLDSDLQIVDPEWSEKALREWFATGANVRVQHQAQRDPAGKGIQVDGHRIRARVVEPVAVKLVKAGVLQDFSVGIMNPDVRSNRDPQFRHLPDVDKATNGVITGRQDHLSKIGEVSLVDRGSNFGTKFAMLKAAADGSAQWAGELTAPDDVLTKVAAPTDSGLTSVELPSDMKLKVTPATLAKMATLKRNLVLREHDMLAEAGTTVTITKGVQFEEELKPEFLAMKAAEAAVYKRDIDTATRRRLASEGHALPNLSYPIENEGDLENAATLARSGHGDVPAATALIGREARRLGVPNPMKKKPGKAKKAAEPDLAKCMKCDGSGMVGEKPCPDCKKGRKAQKAAAALEAAASAPIETLIAKKKGKMRAVCPNCGAKQNPEHKHCPECGNSLPMRALQVKKNHDFMCLKCGHDLDKGEKFCPDCGTENPGHNPMADLKIPANADKSASGKDRVQRDSEQVSKGRKKKGGKKGKMPFGGDQARPFGSEDEKDKPEEKPGKAEKRRKGGKKRYGRDPAEGVTGHDTMGLPPHREPDGAPVEQIENDAHLEDGDQQMKAAMRHKSLAAQYGIEPHQAVLHDLTCPAFSPESVSKAIPHASFGAIDTAWWQAKCLDAAAQPGDIAKSVAAWNEAQALSRAAVTLKTADPQALHRIRLASHEAFLTANDLLGKTFRDATPGPGTAPTPGHVMPQSFRRPYITAGHAAESPQAEGARTFPVISDHPQAQDFHRDYLSAGHASESPENHGRPEPMPTGSAGRPENAASHAGMMQARDYEQATATMHDHLARIAPGMCAMSPPMGSTQGAAHPVPDPVGMIEPHKAKASKADRAAQKAAAKAKAAKKAAAAAARKAEARRSKLARQVIKGKISVDEGRAKLGWEPIGTPETTSKAAGVMPEPQPAVLDADAITAAVKAATAPLAKRIERQDKALRKNRKVLDAIAGQPDTSQAPFRGAGVYKASAAPAAPQTAAEAAALAQTGHLQRLRNDWRNSHIPEVREAAYKELTAQLGLNPMTDNPTHRNPFTT